VLQRAKPNAVNQLLHISHEVAISCSAATAREGGRAVAAADRGRDGGPPVLLAATAQESHGLVGDALAVGGKKPASESVWCLAWASTLFFRCGPSALDPRVPEQLLDTLPYYSDVIYEYTIELCKLTNDLNIPTVWSMLFATPTLDASDIRVIGEIEEFRTRLRQFLYEPRRWKGALRRNLFARAVRGSNSIEGYDVSLDDAIALVEDEEPLDADRRTSLEIIGYRNALTYIQRLSNDPHFRLDESLLRSLHFMMLGHDLDKSPGQYRRGEIFVRDEEREIIVYEGPDYGLVPDLMGELVAAYVEHEQCPVFVRAAMAHLNLVMIHPFRDGNGRMARALQTLVLAREQILAPEFSSIEEWLGRNTADYYDVLLETGGGSWNPERDTRRWVKFNLVAHHMQAQTVLRRTQIASRLWEDLAAALRNERLPERAAWALFDAASGLRVRTPSYAKDAEIETATAARDLRMLVAAGFLEPQGETRARTYVPTVMLRQMRANIAQDRLHLVDPYTAPSGAA
jgi:Fic family protein